MKPSPPKPHWKEEILPAFRKLRKAYFEKYGMDLLLLDSNGEVISGNSAGLPKKSQIEFSPWWQMATKESLRWGQPCMIACPEEKIVWGVPVMRNHQVLGGIVIPPCSLYDEEGDDTAHYLAEKMTTACNGLLEIVEEYNLTNGAQLQLNRSQTYLERTKAEAIHATKRSFRADIREIYLFLEPELLCAMRQGQRTEARKIINRLLLQIYTVGGKNMDALKSFSMELVVMMGRTAMEAGADSGRIMGLHTTRLATLLASRDEEELNHGLSQLLEWLLDEIEHAPPPLKGIALSKALTFMQHQLDQPLDRASVARQCGLSPTYFARMLKKHTGKEFRDLLNHYRTSKACQLLRMTDKKLSEVAQECGFQDQSYFTKVFYRHLGRSPLDFRRKK